MEEDQDLKSTGVLRNGQRVRDRQDITHFERQNTMGITVSMLLIAAGAILKWAVTASTDGVNLQTVGMILLIVGIVSAAVSLAFWSSWGGFRRQTVVQDSGRTVVHESRID